MQGGPCFQGLITKSAMIAKISTRINVLLKTDFKRTKYLQTLSVSILWTDLLLERSANIAKDGTTIVSNWHACVFPVKRLQFRVKKCVTVVSPGTAGC